MSISEEKLDFWIKHNYNVLFIGKAGVGKTAQVIEAFNKNNLKWKYFSAPTLDPHVDFSGIPFRRESADGKTDYLDFILPKGFNDDTVEAIFIDELNRGKARIRNSVLELIQFKSINGRKFHNLRLIWAAINPADSTDQKYDVEALDMAASDRFHVHIEVPYKCSNEYFIKKYGKDQAKSAIAWWNELSEIEKNKVSPRRLDYALDIYNKGGALIDVLPASSGVGKLSGILKNGPMEERVKKLFDSKDEEGSKKLLNSENNYESAKNYIFKDDEMIKFFYPLLSLEKQITELSTVKNVREYVKSNLKDFQKVYDAVVASKANRGLAKEFMRIAQNNLPKQIKGAAIVNNDIIKHITDATNLLQRRYATTQLRESELRKLQLKINADLDISTTDVVMSFIDKQIFSRSSGHVISRNILIFENILHYCFTSIYKNYLESHHNLLPLGGTTSAIKLEILRNYLVRINCLHISSNISKLSVLFKNAPLPVLSNASSSNGGDISIVSGSGSSSTAPSMANIFSKEFKIGP